MSAPSFERLLYTDCRAGGGRGGGNGFQIQAQSAGVDRAQEKMAVSALTYSVQETWISAGRPVDDFPLGFAHASEAGYGTAQSCYLGREVTGGRSGNHLADCLLTRDTEPYGALRPAQLWRSTLWRHAPWDSTDCPPFDGFLEPGPLDTEAVAEWVRSEPTRAQALARLVSVLEDPDGLRVVMVADEPDEAMTWIAAATLLLPLRSAVAVSFKVFVNNLNQVQHRICAVPRSLNPSLVAGGRNPRFHVDATAGVADENGISARAGFWVERLVSAGDPYEVVDAVDVAAALGDDGSRPDARLTAWAITASGEPVSNPSALTRWLADASSTALGRYGAAVAERLLRSHPDAAALRWIDAAVGSGLVALDRVRVRAALMTAEIEEARAGSLGPLRPLDRVEIGPDARRDAESSAGSAILLAADDAGVEALLRVACRHSIALPLNSLRERLHAFVAGWLAEEHTEYRPTEWALQDPILDLLHQQLTHVADRSGPRPLKRMIRQVWPHLIDRSHDPDEPLTWQLQAASVEAAAPGQRADAVRTIFGRLTRGRYRPSSVDGLQQAMLDWRVVGDREALLIATLVPAALPLHPEIESAAIEAAEQQAERPSGSVLSAVDALDRRGVLLSEALIRLNESDRRMRQIVMIARDVSKQVDAGRLVESLELAGSIDFAVAVTWVPPLVRTSLDSPLSWLGAVLLGRLGDELALKFLKRWAAELGRERGAVAASYGTSWYADDDLPASLRPVITRLVTEHLETLPAGRRERFVDLVRSQHLTADLVPVWDSLVEPDRGRQRRFGFSREKNR